MTDAARGRLERRKQAMDAARAGERLAGADAGATRSGGAGEARSGWRAPFPPGPVRR
ncbi:hypothetical protein [Sorangium sp. So ce1097]|uniref:hypothetical protein n=1 Tax=Sorangium sp. So ce1097 TaxID=3133330 RepID=UPI003F5D99C5